MPLSLASGGCLLHGLLRVSLTTMDLELIGDLSDIEIIAVNLSIRDNADLKARYGGRRWRKLKGVGTVRLASGSVRRAEVHWNEAARCRQAEDEDQAAPGLNP